VKRFILATAVAVVALGSFACGEEGTMEKAGKKMDEAVDKLQHGDEGTMEKAGRKVDEAIDEAEEDWKKEE
jgi:hypothetical protein